MKVGSFIQGTKGRSYKIKTLNIGGMANTGFAIEVKTKKEYFYKRFNNITLESEKTKRDMFEKHQNYASKVFDEINNDKKTAQSFPTFVDFFGNKKEVRYFKIMELLKGQDLSEYLKSTHTMEQNFSWIAQFLYVLNEMHKRHIVHTDLKPENVFIKELEPDKKIVQLIDIEDVIFINENIYPINLVGSTLWYSPEHRMVENGISGWSIKDITVKSDVFTICGIIQYLITNGNMENLREKMGLFDYNLCKGGCAPTFDLLNKFSPKKMKINKYKYFCKIIDQGLSFESEERPFVKEIRESLMTAITDADLKIKKTEIKTKVEISTGRLESKTKDVQAILSLEFDDKIIESNPKDWNNNYITLQSLLAKLNSKFNFGTNLGGIDFFTSKKLISISISNHAIKKEIINTKKEIQELKPGENISLDIQGEKVILSLTIK